MNVLQAKRFQFVGLTLKGLLSDCWYASVNVFITASKMRFVNVDARSLEEFEIWDSEMEDNHNSRLKNQVEDIMAMIWFEF